MLRHKYASITWLIAFLLTGIAWVACAVPAYALNTADVDLNARGSISVTMHESKTQQPVPGGELTIYRVADVQRDDANLSFVYNIQFAGCNLSLDNLDDEDLAVALAEYATANNCQGTTQMIPGNATARFNDLQLGLYLVIQNKPADGYNPVMPFLVTLPMNDGNTWDFNVDATPKVELYTEAPEQPPVPDTPKPKGPLPQTGQLNWPVPVLGTLGAVLLVVGGILLFARRGGNSKKHARR